MDELLLDDEQKIQDLINKGMSEAEARAEISRSKSIFDSIPVSNKPQDIQKSPQEPLIGVSKRPPIGGIGRPRVDTSAAEAKLLEDKSRLKDEAQMKDIEPSESPLAAKAPEIQYTKIDEKKYQNKYKPLLNDLKDQAVELAPELASELEAVKAAYSVSKDDLANKQMWEGIIQGIGHIAAGAIGLKTGADLGGLKFDKQDWDAKSRQIMSELVQAKDSAMEKMNARQKDIAQKRSALMDAFNIEDADMKRALDIAKYNAENKFNAARLNEQARQFGIEQAGAEQKAVAKEALGSAAAASKESLAEQKVAQKELESAMSKARSALTMLAKKNNDNNQAAFQIATDEANEAARRAGKPLPYPQEITAEVPGAMFGTNAPTMEDIQKRMSEHLKKQEQPADEKAAALEWLKNNPNHPQAESVRKKLGV